MVSWPRPLEPRALISCYSPGPLSSLPSHPWRLGPAGECA